MYNSLTVADLTKLWLFTLQYIYMIDKCIHTQNLMVFRQFLALLFIQELYRNFRGKRMRFNTKTRGKVQL